MEHNRPRALRIQQKLGAGGVVNQIKYTFTVGELLQIHRRHPSIGVHPNWGSIDNELRVGVAVQIFIVVWAIAGDAHCLPGAQIGQHRVDGKGGSAGTQHQRLLSPHLGPGGLEQVAESVVVRVIPIKSPVRAAEQGVDAADSFGRRGKGVAAGHHRLFIGDGHVQSTETPRPEEGLHLLWWEFHQLVVIACQLPVDGGGKAVAQPLAQQAELQILRAHQQMTS